MRRRGGRKGGYFSKCSSKCSLCRLGSAATARAALGPSPRRSSPVPRGTPSAPPGRCGGRVARYTACAFPPARCRLSRVPRSYSPPESASARAASGPGPAPCPVCAGCRLLCAVVHPAPHTSRGQARAPVSPVFCPPRCDVLLLRAGAHEPWPPTPEASPASPLSQSGPSPRPRRLAGKEPGGLCPQRCLGAGPGEASDPAVGLQVLVWGPGGDPALHPPEHPVPRRPRGAGRRAVAARHLPGGFRSCGAALSPPGASRP